MCLRNFLQNEAKTVECDKELIDRLSVSATAATNELFSLTGVQTTNEEPVPTLSSGAGHDALAMAQLTKVIINTSSILKIVLCGNCN